MQGELWRRTRMKSTAEQISELLGNDGQQWATYEGESFQEVVARYQGKEEWRDGYRTGDVVRVTFPDNSVITVAGDAWDLGYPNCFCWQSCQDEHCPIHGNLD